DAPSVQWTSQRFGAFARSAAASWQRGRPATASALGCGATLAPTLPSRAVSPNRQACAAEPMSAISIANMAVQATTRRSERIVMALSYPIEAVAPFDGRQPGASTKRPPLRNGRRVRCRRLRWRLWLARFDALWRRDTARDVAFAAARFFGHSAQQRLA